ncbi:MAG TPA: hypothetical protein VHD56_01840 [Tepidisphaeraceae bacterium]|nr:hypothetical protein [Tepidisphaeraceae bacterium]
MGNPYFEVLRTYARRCVSSGTAVLLCLFAVPWLIVFSILPLTSGSALGIFLIFLVQFEGALWRHLIGQLAGDQRVLFPHHQKIHLRVFSAVSFVLTIGWPATLLLLHRGGSLSFAAILACSHAIIGLTIVGGVWAFATLLLGWVLLIWLSADSAKSMDPFLNGQHEFLALLMLLSALCMFGIALIQLRELTEDSPRYRSLSRFRNAERNRDVFQSVAEEWKSNNWSRFFGWLPFQRRQYIPASTSLWARARRWRSLAIGNQIFFTTAAAVVMIGLWQGIGRSDPSPSEPFFRAMCLNFIPSMCAVAIWRPLRKYLEIESLRPQDRASFVKELGTALMITYLQVWGVAVAIAIASSAIHGRGSAELTIIGQTLPIQLFSIAMIPWMLLYNDWNDFGFWLIGLVLPLFGMAGATALISDGSYAAAFGITSMFAMFSVGAIKGAYTRWLTVEFAELPEL